MLVYYIAAFVNGFFNSVNKMMNVKAGQCFGTAKGSLINYVEATLLSLALVPGGADPHRRAGVLSLPAGTAGDGGPGDHRPPPGGGTAAPVLSDSPSPSSYQKPRAHVCPGLLSFPLPSDSVCPIPDSS